ncbi:MAG: hypothetical protein ACR2IF_11170 [Terriglobales bacterium]
MKTLAIMVGYVLAVVGFAILGFAVGGLLGVLSLTVLRASHVQLNMLNALWFGAIPGGALGCVVGLIMITRSETRAKRREAPTR